MQTIRLERINNKVLLYSTGNYNQSPGTDMMEKNILKKNIYIYIYIYIYVIYMCVCVYIYIIKMSHFAV